MKKILFVCLGNICRSPALAACFESIIREKGLSSSFLVDSCGLTDYYIGKTTDSRMRKALKKKGLDSDHCAKQFERRYFKEFDYIMAVNHEVFHLLQQHARSQEEKDKIYLACAFSSDYHNQDIPDPFYAGEEAFDHVADICKNACEGFLDFLQKSF